MKRKPEIVGSIEGVRVRVAKSGNLYNSNNNNFVKEEKKNGLRIEEATAISSALSNCESERVFVIAELSRQLSFNKEKDSSVIELATV